MPNHVNLYGNLSISGGSATSFTYTPPAPRKEAGFCEAHGVEHAWEAFEPGFTYSVTQWDGEQTQAIRWCVNCGKKQRLEPERWCDYD